MLKSGRVLSGYSRNLVMVWAGHAAGVGTCRRLEHFTRMRHDMVHRARQPAVKRDTAGECVDLVQKVARCIDKDSVRVYH